MKTKKEFFFQIKIKNALDAIREGMKVKTTCFMYNTK